MEIMGKISGKIDVKRFYMPGLLIRDDCPSCGASEMKDMSHQYVSYPNIGAKILFGFYCDECEHEWEKNIIINITVLGDKGE